jgi:hypothetical protein
MPLILNQEDKNLPSQNGGFFLPKDISIKSSLTTGAKYILRNNLTYLCPY